MESLDKETDYDVQNSKTGEIPEKWTVDDEVYFITAYFDVNGLISFSLNSAYEINSDGESIDKICSLETANNVIKEKYKNTILSNPVNISEIRLEYVPVPKDSENNNFGKS